MKKYSLLLAAAMVAGALTASAKVVPAKLFTDNMVLQQQSNAKIWGKANAGAKVTAQVSWSKQKFTATAGSDGKFTLAVATPAASYTPQTVTLTDGDGKVEIKNVLIGEVWLASGQSNMEMGISSYDGCPVTNSNEIIATAGQYRNKIHAFTVWKNEKSFTVQDTVKGGDWKEITPSTIAECSAAAFFFAKMLNQVLDVPVGLIINAWGGSIIECWLPKELTDTYTDIYHNVDERTDLPIQVKPYIMYNGMLRPIAGYGLKGFIWYQGEGNVGRHNTYGSRMHDLVNTWRKDWGLGDLPFYAVEIAPWPCENNSKDGVLSAYLRESQFKATREIKNSGLVGTNDMVEPWEYENIHPRNKQGVGYRLAYLALNRTYGVKGIEAEGPSYKSMEIKDGKATLSFNNAPLSFNRISGYEGFEMAGNDHKFYPAKAWTQGKNIVVQSDSVKDPVAVRYCFRNVQFGNVSDNRGLPLYPFRTDDWEPYK